jgi:Flp pilus assembly protein TadD
MKRMNISSKMFIVIVLSILLGCSDATTLKTAEENIRLGKEALNAQQYEQAIVRFSEAIKLNHKSIRAYNNRGIAYCNARDFDRAILDFSHIIEIDPTFGKAYNNRAVAYYLKGERDKALQDLEKAQSLGIKVDQKFFDSLKQGEAKTGKKIEDSAPGKPEAQSKDEDKKK